MDWETEFTFSNYKFDDSQLDDSEFNNIVDLDPLLNVQLPQMEGILTGAGAAAITQSPAGLVEAYSANAREEGKKAAETPPTGVEVRLDPSSDCGYTDGCQQEQPRCKTPQHVSGDRPFLVVDSSGLPSPVSRLCSRETLIDREVETQRKARVRLPSSSREFSSASLVASC
jgi:hypothetical protein